MEDEDLLESIEAFGGRLQSTLEPAEGVLAATAGVILCFAGRYFPYSGFFWRAFILKGWPPIAQAVAQMRQRYAQQTGRAGVERTGFTQVRESMQSMLTRLQSLSSSLQARQMPELSQELLGLQSDLAQVAPLAEATTRGEMVGELQRIYKDCLVEATREASSFVGLQNVGDSVATRVNRYSAPRLRLLLERLLHRAGIRLDVAREDPTVSRLVELFIRACSNSIGIAASCFAEARLFSLSNARIGARMAVAGCCRWMVRHGHLQNTDQMKPARVLAEHGLCLAGLYWQFIRGRGLATFLYAFLWGSWGISRTALLLLGLPLVMESWLQASIAARRAGLMDA